MTKVAMLPLMPIRMLTLVRTTYAVLGTVKKKEAGYMRGVIDQLWDRCRKTSCYVHSTLRHHHTTVELLQYCILA